MSLEAIKYTRGCLEILDQLKLPHQSSYVCIGNSEEGYHAIKNMVVRGAPAIALVAALSLAVELENSPIRFESALAVQSFIRQKLAYLALSRPTAVNLSDAVVKLNRISCQDGVSAGAVVERYVQAAEKMLADDIADNQQIGDNGAEFILKDNKVSNIVMLTHCNTGSLATAGYGTALGIIRSLNKRKALVHAYCTETRPYNQGSRLTAYELAHDFPSTMCTLITDSMVAYLMQSRKISAVVVGADRVARNGDTANKIGTYQLAIIAKYHGVQFLVAAPTTSIDLNTPSGSEILIEERPPTEVLTVTGPVLKDPASMDLDIQRIVTVVPGIAHGIGVLNPSFDITPNDLIDAIITENGVALKNAAAKFELTEFFSRQA